MVDARKRELPSQPRSSAVQAAAAAAAAAPPQPARLAQNIGRRRAATAALWPELKHLLRSMACDLATVGQRIKQLKTSQEQVARVIAKIPNRTCGSIPATQPTAIRKPVPTLPSPQTTAQPQAEKRAVVIGARSRCSCASAALSPQLGKIRSQGERKRSGCGWRRKSRAVDACSGRHDVDVAPCNAKLGVTLSKVSIYSLTLFTKTNSNSNSQWLKYCKWGGAGLSLMVAGENRRCARSNQAGVTACLRVCWWEPWQPVW